MAPRPPRLSTRSMSLGHHPASDPRTIGNPGKVRFERSLPWQRPNPARSETSAKFASNVHFPGKDRIPQNRKPRQSSLRTFTSLAKTESRRIGNPGKVRFKRSLPWQRPNPAESETSARFASNVHFPGKDRISQNRKPRQGLLRTFTSLAKSESRRIGNPGKVRFVRQETWVFFGEAPTSRSAGPERFSRRETATS